MTDARRIPPPGELIHAPKPSWLPAFVAAGLVGLLAGLFAGWPYAVAGGVLVLLALRAWTRETNDGVERLPRRQHVMTAVLPAAPPRSDETER
jgi:hypothetical protein